MKSKHLIITMIALLIGAFGCSPQPAPTSVTRTETPKPSPQAESPSALPKEGFKGELTLVNPPAKLRAGQQARIQVKVKNASTVFWWARGGPTNNRSDNKFYIAVGDRWLKPDGSLVTDMDGRIGIGKDLSGGDETEVSLLVTAPKEPGEYTLELDLVQEQVTWFHEKGSPTAKTKVTVTK